MVRPPAKYSDMVFKHEMLNAFHKVSNMHILFLVLIHKLMAAALLVLLLLLAVSSTAFTTTDVYYVTADDAAGQCPPHQICHKLSYYISQPDYYFTSDTTIIFLEGEHSFNREDLVHVGNVHNLTLEGQGQWPVAGAEETVMQSTVIINCTRGRGGFYFAHCHEITVEGLTVVNCSAAHGVQRIFGVFTFLLVQSLLFLKNSIQHMTGYGLSVLDSNNVIITNCSYYHSALCGVNNSNFSGGVGIWYDPRYSNTTLELSHSNMTKCCSIHGGGLTMYSSHRGLLKISFDNLKFCNGTGRSGGISANLFGSGNVTLVVSNCTFFNGTAIDGGGIAAYFDGSGNATLVVSNCTFFNGTAIDGGGISAHLFGSGNVTLVVSNCTFFNGTAIEGGGIAAHLFGSGNVTLVVSNCTFFNGTAIEGGGIRAYFDGSGNVTLVVSNCTFFNGYGGGIAADFDGSGNVTLVVSNCTFFNGTAIEGGGIAAHLFGSGNVTLVVSNCTFFNGTAIEGGGIRAYFDGSGNVTLVVSNCTFFNGYGGGIAADFDGSGNVTLVVSNCTFFNGTAKYGGGIEAYFDGSGNVTLVVSNCTFFNGTAIEGGGIKAYFDGSGNVTLVVSNCTFFNGTAKYGGGIAAYFDGSGNVTLVVSNCIFFNGTAREGGGIFIGVEIQSAKLIIDNTEFINNSGGFASEISIGLINKVPSYANHVLISMLNSNVFTNAYSYYGVYIYGCCASVQITNTSMRFFNTRFVGFTLMGSSRYNAIQMDGCHFIGSTGVPIVIYLYQVQTKIINCIFSNNTSDDDGRSVVIIQLTSFTDAVIHSCIISDNNMTGITLIEAVATFSGHNVIQNNRNTEGAGVTLLTPSYISIEGELLLYNNTAEKHGGALLVTQYVLLTLAQRSRSSDHKTIFTSTPCIMEFENNSSSVIFSGNRAGKGGSDMYGAILMGCSKIEKGVQFSQIPHVGHPNETSWYFDTPLMKHLHFSNTDRLSSMSSDPIMVCFCNTTTNLPDCSDRTHHIRTYPGLEINTSIATVGCYGGTSPGDVQVTAQHATLVRYYGQNQTTNCFQLHILLQNTSSTTALVDIRVKDVVQGLSVSIGVYILECPIGFTPISGQCQCERFLDTSNVQCNLSATPYLFLRSGNSWFGYINNTQCITGTTNCPFDYCNRSNVSFDILAPDRQCVANRTGILCGQCQSHLSIMLGSNHCGTCSNWYLFLLPVFALAGIILVAVLMFLNLSVSVGTINGLLFYANMVKLNEAFFFPNGSVPVASQFISWLNLDLGIEVCLFDGLDGYWNTWLQFVFPAYLFLLIGGIIVGCRYSVWLCRLCGSHAVPALATLFLMSYTKILLTVTNALYMSQLPCNDSIVTVWSVDGNIEYGSGKHLILLVVSCGVLVIGLAYPVLVLCAPLLERYSHKCIPQHCRWNIVAKFKPLLDAYGGPYKDKYRFWTGVTLMMRLTVTVTFSFTSGPINASIIIIILVGILTFWSFTKVVYENIYVSLLEVFYVLNIILLSTVCLASGSRIYQIATIVSVCLSLFVCLVTMAMHLWWNFDLKKIKRRLGFKDQIEYIALPQMAANEDDEEDRPPPGSPPSIVYGSHRGQHQFILEFPHPHEEHESSSPVLLAREPLLFDT